MSGRDGASERRSAQLVILAGAGFAVLEILGHRLPPGYSVPQVVFCRYAVHLVALLLLPGRPAEVWRTRRPFVQLVLSACMLGMPLFFLAGARAVSVSATWAIFWTAPLVTLALGSVLAGETPRMRTWGLAMFACVASAIALGERPRGHLVDWLWPLGMSACFAAYLVLGRLLRQETTASKLFYVALGVFAALTPSVAGQFVIPDARATLILAAIGLVGLAALFAIDRALERATVADLAPFAFAAVPFTVLLEALISSVGRRAALGALLVSVALVVHYFSLAPAEAGERR